MLRDGVVVRGVKAEAPDVSLGVSTTDSESCCFWGLHVLADTSRRDERRDSTKTLIRYTRKVRKIGKAEGVEGDSEVVFVFEEADLVEEQEGGVDKRGSGVAEDWVGDVEGKD